MSEKVVLTQEQAKELKGFKKLGRTLDDWISNKNNPLEPNSELHQLKLDEMAKVLYAGDYEVEQPKFKEGDKVFWVSQDGSIKEFCEIDRERIGEGEPCWWFTDGDWSTEKQLRHATPEEIYWLHELGRDKIGDFHEGDVIITQEVSYRYSTDGEVDTIGPHTTQLWLDEGIIKGIYPAESFKPFKKEPEE